MQDHLKNIVPTSFIAKTIIKKIENEEFTNMTDIAKEVGVNIPLANTNYLKASDVLIELRKIMEDRNITNEDIRNAVVKLYGDIYVKAMDNGLDKQNLDLSTAKNCVDSLAKLFKVLESKTEITIQNTVQITSLKNIIEDSVRKTEDIKKVSE